MFFIYKILKKTAKYGKICKKELRKIDWLNFEINEKNYKKILIIGIVIILIYLIITFITFAIPSIYHMEKNTVEDTQGVIKTDVNGLYRGSFKLQISAWAYKEGQDLKTFDNYFILKSKANGKMYKIRAAKKTVPELQFVDGYNCLNCGMEAQSIVLGLQDGDYELYILYKSDNENMLVDTGVNIEL